MIAWTPTFPRRERPLGYLRLLQARYRYYDRVRLGREKWRPVGRRVRGYQYQLASWHNKFKGARCFVIANGPSLKKMDLSPIKRAITIGCNGIYTAFPQWGFHTHFVLFEDIEQLELRRHEVSALKSDSPNYPIKLAALYNAYAIRADRNTLFFNGFRTDNNDYYWYESYPQFSRDFSVIAHGGSSVTYLMLQWAYHLGCDPVYIIGLDHDYGELPKLFPPGKITITEDNIDKVRGLHFSDDYYKVGDQLGVPWLERQERAYALAREEFERVGRKIYNAGIESKLDVFEKAKFGDLFE